MLCKRAHPFGAHFARVVITGIERGDDAAIFFRLSHTNRSSLNGAAQGKQLAAAGYMQAAVIP